MGYKTAADHLKDEIANLSRRITRVEEERDRLREAGLCSELMTEVFENRIADLRHALKKVEATYEARKHEPGARHRSDFNQTGWKK